MATGNILAQGNIDKMAIVRRTVDFPSIPANSSASYSIPVPGVRTGDIAFVTNAGTTNAAGIVLGQCNITAADNIVVRVANITTGAVDDGSRDVYVIVIRPDAELLSPGW